jgi:hypothetical protein
VKRLAAIAVLVLLTGDGLVARQPETYSPDDAGFEVRFPARPKEMKATPTTKLGKLKVVTATYANADNNVFMVSYTDFPDGTAKGDNRDVLLDGVREGLKGKDGTVLLDNDVKVGADKLPGRELVLQKDKQHVRVTAVLRGDRLFQVGVVGTKEFVSGQEAAAFLKSFELVK